MNDSLISQMILLFALMATGYISNKTGILDELSNARFSRFLLNIALPATILNSACNQTYLERTTVLSVMGIAAGIFIILPILSKLIAKVFHLDATYQLMLNYSNLGFMGFPIIGSLYGTQNVFYAAIFMMVFNVHIFTVGIITLRGKTEHTRELLKKLCTPGIASAVIAFIIVMVQRSFPAPVTQVVESLSVVTTPLAMIVIGSQLAQVNILEVIKTKKLYLMSFFKLIVYPFVVYLCLYYIIGNSMITNIAVILVGLPVAGNVTMICTEYGGNAPLAAQGTCISTLLSLITIPVMMMFM